MTENPSSFSSSSSSSSSVVVWEDVLERQTAINDVVLLEEKYHQPQHRLQSQWTLHNDAVQEHFSSHVLLNGETFKLPKEIVALKSSAKESWVLYKKRECERRKRIRKRIADEKSKDNQHLPSNLLLALVDRCEFCKRLFVTVNLFWGVTLCDICYFNEGVIHEIMHRQKEKTSLTKLSPTSLIESLLIEKKSHQTQSHQSPHPLKRKRSTIQTEEDGSNVFYNVVSPKVVENPFEEEMEDILITSPHPTSIHTDDAFHQSKEEQTDTEADIDLTGIFGVENNMSTTTVEEEGEVYYGVEDSNYASLRDYLIELRTQSPQPPV